MRAVLPDERPDYVFASPTILCGYTFKENATTLIDEIVAPLNSAKIPFSSSHGNHDNQANITHLEEIMREQQVSPLSYTRIAPPGVGGEGGPGNYWVPVYRNSADRAPVLILWFFDSRGGVSPNPNPTALPDWVDASVSDWIKSETEAMEAEWGPMSDRGALAFVHIPPHVVSTLQAKLDPTRNPGLNANSLGSGSVQDSSSTGQDGPFWDALNLHVKNIHAVISGHVHGNEWCIREQVKDVIFCFDNILAKFNRYGGYDDDGWGHGVRNIQFSSPNPQAGPETWIRLEDGETRARITLNQQYKR
ncbi:hypothetical protein BD779DRAFT_1558559 [Infundibulicybe gibba]|nr:hypothetical protein BD779DRAFT_1558559 [Infundibulicybe gibba]